MNFFVNAGKILIALLLGFMVSVFAATSALADCYKKVCIVIVSGETPVIQDLKSLYKIGGHLILTNTHGLIKPHFFHKQIYTKSLPGNTGTLTQRRMLNTAYSEPVVC